jgi:hypothetical protein
VWPHYLTPLIDVGSAGIFVILYHADSAEFKTRHFDKKLGRARPAMSCGSLCHALRCAQRAVV